MLQNRILRKELYDYFTEKTTDGEKSNRDCLIDYVRAHIKDGTKSVALCFRGSFASLYYRCHQLLRIKCSRTAIIGEFDYRHSRFTNNYKQILDRLKTLGANIDNFSDKDNDTTHRYVRFDLTEKKAVSRENLAEILQIYKSLIDDFLDPAKREYAYDKKQICRKSHNTEKDRQQQLYAAYFLNDVLTYYDIEYTEHNSAANNVPGRFDLLGLRKENGAYTLLLTELKSTLNACDGKSGIAKHESDYTKYLDSSFIETRKAEASSAINLLCKIFGLPELNITPENIRQVKIKFVFSDKAIPYGEKYTPNDCRIEKEKLSSNGMEIAY